MRKRLARKHRRIAEGEHRAEDRMKGLAEEMPDPNVFRNAAEQVSERADQHIETAERLESEEDSQ